MTTATQAKAYQEATTALAAGELDTAYAQFVAAGVHGDATEQADRLNQYMTADADMESGQYMKARVAYKELGGYLDSADKLETCNAALYGEAAKLMESGDIAGAYVAYSHISDYADSASIVDGIKGDYDAAAKLLKEGKYDEANAAFAALKNYSDSETQAQACYEEGHFAEATSAYETLGQYELSLNQQIRFGCKGLQRGKRECDMGNLHTAQVAER